MSDESENRGIVMDELIVDVSYMKPNSKFGISPFQINLTHQDAPLEYLFKLERAIRGQNNEQQER